MSPRALAPADGGVLQPIASPQSFPIAPPWNPAAGAATAPGWGSPPGQTTGGWGSPPAQTQTGGWGSPPAPAATGWAAPPPQGGFTPAPPRATSPSQTPTGWAAAPPPSSALSGGFNARRAVHKEMPAAPPTAPQAPDRASPGPGGRGRGSTLPSWMTKGDALLT